MANSVTLWRPNIDKKFILQTDFSRSGIGAVLSQEDTEGRERPVCFASRSLQGAETFYAATEGECLAVVWAVEKFRVYLMDKPFELQTDHIALEWLNSAKFTNYKLVRWSLVLQQFQYTITYKPGPTNSNADSMSRLIQKYQVTEVKVLMVNTRDRKMRIDDPWEEGALINLSNYLIKKILCCKKRHRILLKKTDAENNVKTLKTMIQRLLQEIYDVEWALEIGLQTLRFTSHTVMESMT